MANRSRRCFKAGERALAESMKGYWDGFVTGVPSDETDAAWPIFHAAGQRSCSMRTVGLSCFRPSSSTASTTANSGRRTSSRRTLRKALRPHMGCFTRSRRWLVWRGDSRRNRGRQSRAASWPRSKAGLDAPLSQNVALTFLRRQCPCRRAASGLKRCIAGPALQVGKAGREWRSRWDNRSRRRQPEEIAAEIGVDLNLRHERSSLWSVVTVEVLSGFASVIAEEV